MPRFEQVERYLLSAEWHLLLSMIETHLEALKRESFVVNRDGGDMTVVRYNDAMHSLLLLRRQIREWVGK